MLIHIDRALAVVFDRWVAAVGDASLEHEAGILRGLAHHMRAINAFFGQGGYSRRLMQRISVDLPEPEGPQITMRSPA
jgi:hypothetical protein